MEQISTSPDVRYAPDTWNWPSQWPGWFWFALQMACFALMGLKIFVHPKFEYPFYVLGPVLFVWGSLDLAFNRSNRWLEHRSPAVQHAVKLVLAVSWLLVVLLFVWSLPGPGAAAN